VEPIGLLYLLVALVVLVLVLDLQQFTLSGAEDDVPDADLAHLLHVHHEHELACGGNDVERVELLIHAGLALDVGHDFGDHAFHVELQEVALAPAVLEADVVDEVLEVGQSDHEVEEHVAADACVFVLGHAIEYHRTEKDVEFGREGLLDLAEFFLVNFALMGKVFEHCYQIFEIFAFQVTRGAAVDHARPGVDFDFFLEVGVGPDILALEGGDFAVIRLEFLLVDVQEDLFSLVD